MIIRPAVTEDAAQVMSILNALIRTTAIEWTDALHTPESTVEWLDEHHAVLVAEEEDLVLGVAAYGWFRDVVTRPGYRYTVENTVHVRDGRRGTGVGRALMRALMDGARAEGMHTMVAAIDGANEGSLRFHERMGFEQVARMSEIGAKFGRWHDLLLLQVRLDDRASPDA